MNLRVSAFLALGMFASLSGGAAACTLNEIQKADMRRGLCRQQVGIATGYACTSLLMQAQVADQFEQIELARRCGFNAEADKLDRFYQATTPYVAKLYSCIDTAIDRAAVETKAKEQVAQSLAKQPAGCPADVKEKMAKRLPNLIESVQRSYRDIQSLAGQIELVPD
ncbi:hypothetical protein [Hyphomicrobium sp.]|uniref:hypothetical protein n=1 Tax=Hyphomicrobium sp. TaxID=82 RepID=UPI002D79BDF8|nr:hypothetical protein [Hyphomicrobium sp.]HET6388995.1 hypothetical protein [Hyphomicrobium sp.]